MEAIIDRGRLRIWRSGVRALGWWGLVATALAWAGPVRAACEDPYTLKQWHGAVVHAELATRDGDYARAGVVLSAAYTRLPCLDKPVSRIYLARFARLMALLAFYAQDADQVRRWGLLSRLTERIPWPEHLEGHPLRAMIEGEQEPEVGGPAGRGFVVPPRTAVFVNGRLRLVPQTWPELPTYVQLRRKNKVLQAWWQDGARFPREILGDGGPLPTPRWYHVDEFGDDD